MLRVEVCARALRASQNVKKVMRALCARSAVVGGGGYMAGFFCVALPRGGLKKK